MQAPMTAALAEKYLCGWAGEGRQEGEGGREVQADRYQAQHRVICRSCNHMGPTGNQQPPVYIHTK
jgi:hypothetical protein